MEIREWPMGIADQVNGSTHSKLVSVSSGKRAELQGCGDGSFTETIENRQRHEVPHIGIQSPEQDVRDNPVTTVHMNRGIGGNGVSDRGRQTAGEITGQKWGELPSAEGACPAVKGMGPEQYPSKNAEEECEHPSLDIEEPVQFVGILETTGISERNEIVINVDVTHETKQGAESLVTCPVLLRECGEFVETYDKDPGNIFAAIRQQPTSRKWLGVESNAEVLSFESDQIDGVVASLPEGAKRQDSEPTQDQDLRESKGISNSCTLTMEELVEEIENFRVKYASSQAEVSQLADKLNGSNCKVGLLELELDTERERNERHSCRIKELENKMTSNSVLIGLLSECKTKVEQLEALKQSSQELIFKFQESKETAIHLRERIAELESQQAIKEQMIEELMDQLSECTKTTEAKNEVEEQQEELISQQSPSRMSRQTVHTHSESRHQGKRSVSYSSPSSTNTSKVCMIL